MQELFRLHTKNEPKILNKEVVESIGIQSHPDEVQSVRYKNWVKLCKENNFKDLKSEMIKFLQSKDSVTNIDDLGKDWSSILSTFLYKGNKLTKENVDNYLKGCKVDSLFGKEKVNYYDKYMAVADTLIALAYLGKLSYKGNIDYQVVLKTMQLVNLCVNFKNRQCELNIQNHFEKPILLPTYFTKNYTCDDAHTTNSKFPFLEEQNENEIKGCKSGDCKCNENDDCVKQSKCCVKPRIDKIELMVVKTETKCYRAGDLSYIKNVLQGEKLSTKHSELIRTEELTETESDIKQFEEQYLQTEDKTSMQNETQDVLKKDSGFNAGITTNFEYGVNLELYNLKASGGATANYSNNTSRSNINKSVQDYSKDIINRTTKQLEQKVRNLSSIRRIHETSEKNKHSFDNSEGNDNVNGQYLFVNKISKAQVYNYGLSSVIDLILPEPAALYKRLFEKKFEGEKPTKPAEITILPKDITHESYKSYAIKYGISDLAEPPKLNIQGNVHFEGGTGEAKYIIRKLEGYWSGSGTEYNSSPVNEQDGYVIDAMYADLGSGSILFNGHSVYGKIVIEINSASISRDTDGHGPDNISIVPPYDGSQTMNLTGVNVTWLKIDVKVNFKLKDEKLLEWQMGIYSKIIKVYEESLEKYEKDYAKYLNDKNEVEAKEAELKKERYNKNPFILRELEKAELKRMAISYISCQFYDQFDAMKSKVEPCGYPEMNVKEAYEEGKFIQFFEQAFNWNLMTYIFYPYFWGKKCGWGKNVKEEATDLIFEKFLQAGSCHVQIPIRPTHHALVQHFIDYGEIWNGSSEPPIPADVYYVSLAQEIKEQFQNFNTEREGTIDAIIGQDEVILNGTNYYWNATLSDSDPTNDVNINKDLDREILLDYKTYRIVSIEPNFPLTSTIHDSWKIKLDRNYEGKTQNYMKWSTGALYIGAPWEFITPTNLVFLRSKSKCLPCYPLDECKEL